MRNVIAKARAFFSAPIPPQLPAIDLPLAPLKRYAAEQGASLLSITHLLRYVLIDHPTERVHAVLTAYAVTIDSVTLQPVHGERESKIHPGVSSDVEAIIRVCVSHAQFAGIPADAFDSTALLAAIVSHPPSASVLEPLGLSAQKVLYFLSHGKPLPDRLEDEMGLAPREVPVWVRIENDPYSTMEAVLLVLQQVFELQSQDALQTLYQIHLHGAATLGPYPYPEAERRALQVRSIARDLAQPLRALLSSEPAPSQEVPLDTMPPAIAALAQASASGRSKRLAPHWRSELGTTATFWRALGGSLVTLYGGSLLIQSLHLHTPPKIAAVLVLAVMGSSGYIALSLWVTFLLALCTRFGFRLPRTIGPVSQVCIGVLLSFALRPYLHALVDVLRDRPLAPQFSISIEDQHTLHFNGGLGAGATHALENALDVHPEISTIRLEGPGGLAFEGYLMGRVIRAHRLQTRVDGACASACTLAFLGGSPRSLGTGAQLLFHRARLRTQADSTDSSIINLALSRYMRQRGVSKPFIERVFSTPASTLWQPTMGELLDNGVADEISLRSTPQPLSASPAPTDLRKELSPYVSLVQQHKLPQTVLVPTKGNAAGVTSSRFRGQPYWPKHLAYPRDAAGVPMVMLVQLNFAEMPPLPSYPTSGILQFFVSSSAGEGHYLGMSSAAFDSDDSRARFTALQKPEYFRVIYHPLIEDSKNLLLQAPLPGRGQLPFYDAASLAFKQRDSYVGPGDYRFERLFGATESVLEATLGNDFKPIERYWQSLQAQTLATVGGYSRTEQGFDPRSAVLDEDWLVLLSIDGSADSDLDITWEDGGVANWWIERSALERLDFSRVAYYWDTG